MITLCFQTNDVNNTDPEELVISNVTKADAGLYTCLVSNIIGINHVSAHLMVYDDEDLDSANGIGRKIN